MLDKTEIHATEISLGRLECWRPAYLLRLDIQC